MHRAQSLKEREHRKLGWKVLILKYDLDFLKMKNARNMR